MLSLTHPYIYATIRSMPMGMVAERGTDAIVRLAIKAPKEYLVAAKARGGFKVHVLTLDFFPEEIITIGLASIFIDDAGDELVLRTAMPEAASTHSLRDALLSDWCHVYFFDEDDRELLGYEAEIRRNDEVAGRSLREAEFVEDSPKNSMRMMRGIKSQLSFERQIEGTDDNVVSFDFVAALFPDDRVVADTSAEFHSFHGGVTSNQYRRVRPAQPGLFRVLDVVRLLHHVFLPQQIHHEPFRRLGTRAKVDVLVAHADKLLFILVENGARALSRRKATAGPAEQATLAALLRATRKISTAIRFAKTQRVLNVPLSGGDVEVDVTGKTIYGLAILEELIDSWSDDYAPVVQAAASKVDAYLAPMDYGQFFELARHAGSEDDVFRYLERESCDLERLVCIATGADLSVETAQLFLPGALDDEPF